jgi:predicted DNA-binding ribbon-helix-helix protein
VAITYFWESIGRGDGRDIQRCFEPVRHAKTLPRSPPASGRHGKPAMKSLVVKRSVVIAGHKTSISLEDAFWKGLKEIAGIRNTTLSDLLTSIDAGRQQANLSSAIRLFILDFHRSHLAEVAAREPVTARPASTG